MKALIAGYATLRPKIVAAVSAAQALDEASVSRVARVRDDDAIVGRLLGAVASESNVDGHLGSSESAEVYR